MSTSSQCRMRAVARPMLVVIIVRLAQRPLLTGRLWADLSGLGDSLF